MLEPPPEPDGYRLLASVPTLPGGMALWICCVTAGPPYTFCTAPLSMPYSTAWRTRSLPAAPPAFGLRVLNTTYGKTSVHAQILKFGRFFACRPGMDDGL